MRRKTSPSFDFDDTTLKVLFIEPQAFEAQRLEVHREVAQMAGLEWSEYCQLHDLPG